MNVKTWGCGFVVVAMTSLFGEKVDSTFIQPLTAEKSYSSTTLWLHGKPANGGGFLSFSNQTEKCKSNLNVNKEGYVIGGVDFGDGMFTISGNPITLSGEGVIRGTNTTGARFANQVIIPAGSTMTKCGAGKVTMEKGNEGLCA